MPVEHQACNSCGENPSEATLGDSSGVTSSYDTAEEGFPKVHIKHVELVLAPGAVEARDSGNLTFYAPNM